jgi:hypothetical protein
MPVVSSESLGGDRYDVAYAHSTTDAAFIAHCVNHFGAVLSLLRKSVKLVEDLGDEDDFINTAHLAQLKEALEEVSYVEIPDELAAGEGASSELRLPQEEHTVTPERCIWVRAWIGRCEAMATAHGCCEQHQAVCCSCGAPATHDCEETGDFVCGALLCDERLRAYHSRRRIKRRGWLRRAKSA